MIAHKIVPPSTFSGTPWLWCALHMPLIGQGAQRLALWLLFDPYIYKIAEL